MTRREDFPDLYETEKSFRRNYKKKEFDAQEQLEKGLAEQRRIQQEIAAGNPVDNRAGRPPSAPQAPTAPQADTTAGRPPEADQAPQADQVDTRAPMGQQDNQGQRDYDAAAAGHKKDSEDRIAGRTGQPKESAWGARRAESKRQKASDKEDMDYIKANRGKKAEQAAKPKQKGLKGFMKRRRAMILGGGVAGISGLMFSGFLFFGPAFGLVDMISNIGDFEFEPTNEIRGRRQARLLADFMRGGTNDVFEGTRTGRYQTRLGRAWSNYQIRKVADRLIDAGGVMEFDPDLQDGKGNYINRKGGKATGAPQRNRPTRFGSTPETAMDLWDPETKRLLPADRLRQLDLIPEAGRTMKAAYPSNNPISATKRVYLRQAFNAATGVRWSKLFTQEGPSKAITTFYRRVLGLDTFRADNVVDPVRDVDPDNPPTDVNDPGGNEFTSDGLEAVDDALKKGENPSSALRKATAALSGRIGKTIGASSAIAGLTGLACLANQLYEDDVVSKWMAFSSVLNFGATTNLLEEEIRLAGFIDAEEVGDLENELHSRNNIRVDDNGNVYKDVLSSSDSASFQRSINSEVVDGEELGPQYYFNYPGDSDNFVTDMFKSFGSFGIAPPDFLCDALSFWITDIVLGAAECIISVGAGCWASEVFFFVFGGQIISAILGLGARQAIGVIPTDPAQWAGNLAQADSLMNTLESTGAAPISDQEYNDGVLTKWLDQRQEETRELPFMERYFAMSTPGSLMQKLATWRADILSNSLLENVLAVLKAPFTLIGKLFSYPVSAQQSQTCLSTTDYRTIENNGVCVQLDHFGLQKYTWDVDLDYCGATIGLLDGVLKSGENTKYGGYRVVEDVGVQGDFVGPPEYDSYWVENTVLSIASYDNDDPDGHYYEYTDPVTGDIIRVEDDCLRSEGNAGYVKQVAEVCHGLLFRDPTGESVDEAFTPQLNAGSAYSMISDPNTYGVDESIERNELYQELCVDSVNKNLGLWVLLGRYVDDIKIQMAGFVGLTNPGAFTSSGEAIPSLAPITAGTNQEAAQAILERDNISFASGAVRTSIEQVAEDGTAAIVTTNNTEEVWVDRDILALVLNIAVAYPDKDIRLGLLTTGDHPADSPHYQGKAVTISASGSVAEDVLPYIYAYKNGLLVDQLIHSDMPEGTATLQGGEDFDYPAETTSMYDNYIFISVF
ncbi:MAG: hypothetical protein R3313_00095 [Candidatus Saccharimonadales bacterium]|nr:hypothetical protein [Candidatus Saccharimonadales bacterium]